MVWGQMKLQQGILKEGRIRSEARSVYLLSILKIIYCRGYKDYCRGLWFYLVNQYLFLNFTCFYYIQVNALLHEELKIQSTEEQYFFPKYLHTRV